MRRIVYYLLSIIGLGLIMSSSPAFANEELQKQMEKLRNQSDSLVKQLNNFQKSQNNVQAKPTAVNIDDAQTQRMMKKMLRRYQNMSVEEIKGELLQGSQGTKANQIFRQYPKTLEFMARIYQSKDAIPRALEMRSNMDKLKKVGFFMLGTFIFSFILGKIMIRPAMGLMRRITMGFFKALIVWFLRAGIIVYFYGYYLSPMWDIFDQVFIQDFLTNKI